MHVLKNVYYGGKRRALTMSYDDGTIHDRRLAKTFDRWGIRGSFHLNSGWLDNPGHLTSDELPEVFANHEISLHSLTHPSLEYCPRETIIAQIMQDRANLEKAARYPVRGMSYPNGSYSAHVTQILRACGVVCSRTVAATHDFRLPEDFLVWHPTCHHNDHALELLDTFLARKHWGLDCFFLWGHSYEFDMKDNWELIEEFCRRAGGDEETWYATNIEIYDYIQALRALRCSADGHILQNPCSTDLWVTVDGEVVKVGAGQTLVL